MKRAVATFLNFSGVALLYRSSLLSNNCCHEKIKVQVSDTMMLNKVTLLFTKK